MSTIAIIGKDGTGKSVFAKLLAYEYKNENRKDVIAIIDTDMTQPTLLKRIPEKISSDKSVGDYMTNKGAHAVNKYMHQDLKKGNIMYMGTTNDDRYNTYDFGFDDVGQSSIMIDETSKLVDHVVLDVSGQKHDPFFMSAIKQADIIIIMAKTNMEGVCYLRSINAVMNVLNREDKKIMYVASQKLDCEDAQVCEKYAGVTYTALLPFSYEIMNCDTMDMLNSKTLKTRQSKVYIKEIKKILKSIG